MLSPERLAQLQEVLTQIRARFPDAQWEAQSIPGNAPLVRCTIQGERRWIPLLPGPMVLCTSLLEARRKVLLYEVEHPHLPPGLGRKPPEDLLPPRESEPAKALFETHTVVRVAVQADRQAKEFLERGNNQMRLFPLALSEAFGHLAGVKEVLIRWSEPKEMDVPVLRIDVVHELEHYAHLWHVRTDDLMRPTPTKEPAFQARFAASELARLYVEHIAKKENEHRVVQMEG